MSIRPAVPARWEERHRDAFGCSAWERALHHAWVLTCWRPNPELGGQPDPHLAEQDGLAVASVLYGAAQAHHLLVDDLPLDEAALFATTVLSASLDPPRPRPPGPGHGAVLTDEGLGRVLRALGPHDAGADPSLPSARVGYRTRDLLARPGGHTRPYRDDWSMYVGLAWDGMDQAGDRAGEVARRAEGIRPPEALRRLAATHPDLRVLATEGQLPRATAGISWLSHAGRLICLSYEVVAAIGQSPLDPSALPLPVMGAIRAYATAVDSLAAAARDLQGLWRAHAGQRPEPDPARWAEQEIPPSLHAQLRDTERCLAAICAVLLGPAGG